MTRLEALSSAALRPVWLAVHGRLSSGRPVRRVRVGPLDAEGRVALADLLGLDRLPAEHVTLSVDTLDEVLTGVVGMGLRQVVSELVGPVGDRVADRQRAEAERTRLWEWLAGHEVVRAQPVLQAWVEQVRPAGVKDGSVARAMAELESALAVLARLPAAGTPLPVLADEALGDPHGLDEGTRLAVLVLRALVVIYQVEPPVDAPGRRALWERAGVTDDELSPVVLVAGLRPAGEAAGNAVLRACAERGEAAALTLRQVRRLTVMAGLPADVWAFENPSVLALATARFGRRCPPLVCTSGWPNSAAILLLRRLGAAGCRLHYHGDFDGEGVRIAANVIARTGAEAWRMGSQDYLRAVRANESGNPVGRITEAPWDAELAGHLRRWNRTVSEERVAEEMLAELVLP